MVAVNTVNNLLYLVESGLLGLFVISSFFGYRNLCGLHITLKLPDEVFAMTEYPVRMAVSNTRRFMPAFLLRIQVAGRTLLFPYLEPRGNRITEVPVSFAERGAAVIEGATALSVFPFNFVRRERRIGVPTPVIVFPQPIEGAAIPSSIADRPSAGELQTGRPGEGTEVLSVRNYRAGDALRKIHWKASARTGKLKTKETAAAVDHPLVIDLAEIAEADLEKKLSSLAYLILSLLKRNVKVGLRLPGKFHPPGSSRLHRRAMLKELALYDPENRRNQD